VIRGLGQHAQQNLALARDAHAIASRSARVIRSVFSPAFAIARP
jgi:hypothetical protein